MPALLKFLTVYALACLAFFIFSVVPIIPFSIDGHPVSYHEWWRSGAGPFVSLLGLVGSLAGLLLMKKARHARNAYIAFTTLGFVLPYPFLGDPPDAIAGIALVFLVALYLYKRQSVQAYFCP